MSLKVVESENSELLVLLLSITVHFIISELHASLDV